MHRKEHSRFLRKMTCTIAHVGEMKSAHKTEWEISTGGTT
jgi:hypothetical protein